jgi:hypothetical protein
LLFRVAIAAVIILSIHKCLRTIRQNLRGNHKQATRLWRLDGPCLRGQSGCLRQAG